MTELRNTEFYLEAALGNIPGRTTGAVSGQHDAIGTSFVDMWMNTSNLVYPTAAESWEIVSSSANDTSAGSGARTITVHTLTDGYVEQSQTVTMNGTTPVALTGTHFRKGLLGMFVASAGGVDQDSFCDGTITVRVASAGAVRIIMGPRRTNDLGVHLTVPIGKTIVVSQSSALVPKNKDVTLQVLFQPGGVGPFLQSASSELYQSILTILSTAPLVLPEKSEYLIQGKTTDPSPITTTTFSEILIIEN